MPRFSRKMNVSHVSLWKPHKCVFKHSAHGLFCQDDQFDASHAYVYSKNAYFPNYLFGNPINIC